MTWLNHTVSPQEAGQPIEALLTGTLQISRRRIQKLTRTKGIQLNRKPTYLAKIVQAGDIVAVRTGDRPQPGLQPTRIPLDIRYEDTELIVLNKPAGLLVYPLRPDQTQTLANGLRYHWQQHDPKANLHFVHRLDRDTSGLILVAKQAVTHAQLAQQLADRRLQRHYQALVTGVVGPDAGLIDAPIGKHPQHPNLRAIDPAGDPARTHFQVETRFADATLLQLTLETGRTHQIRVHLAHLGHPVWGDRQYGGPTSEVTHQALHAAQLSFVHPSGGQVVAIEAPLPEAFGELLEERRNAERGTRNAE